MALQKSYGELSEFVSPRRMHRRKRSFDKISGHSKRALRISLPIQVTTGSSWGSVTGMCLLI